MKSEKFESRSTKRQRVLDVVRRRAFAAAMSELWSWGVLKAGPNSETWMHEFGALALEMAELRPALRTVTVALAKALQQPIATQGTGGEQGR